ncbi:ABC transporter substrate-binding protein [Saccharospirillum impatiens]|uniref:ABC transporter substrate-binding protein n=1 Tax=Saccharospirillum impatiens TaxID=169438 RepID=UPI00042A240B|nr:extracellular solute-binding protein [Saccharospirillum impatiens]
MRSITVLSRLSVFALSVSLLPVQVGAGTVSIATVGNGDMERMKTLSRHFERDNPGTVLVWEVVNESVLRLMQSRDSKRDTPRFDVYTVGILEASLWGQSGRLDAVPDGLAGSLAEHGWIPEVIRGFQVNDRYFGLPFYGESSITYYRKDVFERLGLNMPDRPQWSDIESLLSRMSRATDGARGRICLRGKSGWGENMALFSTMVNSFGGRWFDLKWQSTIHSQQWMNAIEFYLELQTRYGLETPWENGYSESLSAFSNGDCDIWVDSTAAGGALAASEHYRNIGYRQAPYQETQTGANWLWAWGFSVPDRSSVKDEAWRFIEWATSEEYQQLVAREYGIQFVPPGTRHALYENPDYLRYASFAAPTIEAIQSTDFDNSSVQPIPYRGVQFVQSEEFQQVGNHVGGLLARALEDYSDGVDPDLDDLLASAEEFSNAAHRIARYLTERGIDTYE